MKYGFELEMFCTRSIGVEPGNVEPCLVPDGLPYDECGWLIEVRSEPHSNIRKAIALFQAEIDSVKEKAAKANILTVTIPLMEIPRNLKVAAQRKHGKGLLTYRNIYGHETHRNSTKLATASIHVSFTNKIEWHYTNDKGLPRVHKYPGFVDHARLIIGLDRAFAAEIKAAKRNPGFYEVKGDGRVEYRSLPNNVDLEKLRKVLEALTSNTAIPDDDDPITGNEG